MSMFKSESTWSSSAEEKEEAEEKVKKSRKRVSRLFPWSKSGGEASGRPSLPIPSNSPSKKQRQKQSQNGSWWLPKSGARAEGNDQVMFQVKPEEREKGRKVAASWKRVSTAF
ncbi:hypothetical protein BT69DRAFT_1278604 [Atractiella rhizophila]|nr:hypothetical protein BT69DRAFT_1278604 [Atractiella rhizophila]